MSEKSLLPLTEHPVVRQSHFFTRQRLLVALVLLLLLPCNLLRSSWHPGQEALVAEEYLEVLKTSNLARNWSYEFTKDAHLAGTNPELVKWQLAKFAEYGLTNVHSEDFDIYLNYPNSTYLALVENGTATYHPSLKEDELAEDPTTVGPGLVPAFHGYLASGNVTAEYVYINYGTVEDFEVLARHGVSIKGKIAVVRYGKIFRGLKVKFAQEAGAVGVLLYSEPADDGEITVDKGYKAYPHGPARNPSALERGSVQFLSQIPGDPTTPGWPSKGDDVKRVDPHHSIPKIPSLPISFQEVVPILKKLNGHGLNLGQNWTGSLHGVDYNIGPNPDAQLNLVNNQIYNISKLYNVYGEIEGHLKNEVILVGNHRDAWIRGGAGDPNSGSAAVLEVVRALSEVKAKIPGWKPLRTIRFASWDGEEYGLLGLTEYGELYHKQLQKETVAYLNIDVAAAGTNLGLSGSPLLYGLLNDNAKKVAYPKNGSLHSHFYENHKQIGFLGSGSDYTVFLEHLGIPSVDIGFSRGKADPVYHYHSNYDSFHWIDTYGDPGFKYHNTIAQYVGLLALDLSGQKVLKFGLTENAKEIEQFFDKEVEQIPEQWYDEKKQSRPKGAFTDEDIFEENFSDEEYRELLDAMFESGVHVPLERPPFFGGFFHWFKKARGWVKGFVKHGLVSFKSDHGKHHEKPHGKPHGKHGKHGKASHEKAVGKHGKHGKHGKPHHKKPSHDEPEDHNYLKFLVESVRGATQKFIKTSSVLEERIGEIEVLYKQLNHYSDFNPIKWIKKHQLDREVFHINLKLKFLERIFLYYHGLRDRSWFRHVVYASGRNTGYTGQPLPGLSEAVEDKDVKDTKKWLRILNHTLRRASGFLHF